MSNRPERRSSENGLFAYMKWVLTAISGVMTSAFIVLLGPVSS